MAGGYFGRGIDSGHNTLDRLTGDDSTVSFALTYPPGSTTSITVVVDNVIQEPDESYSVSGYNIVFSEAPPIPAMGVMYNVYIIHNNLSLSIPTPGDGTVTQAKLAENVKNFYPQSFTGDNSTTDFTLNYPVQKSSSILVREDGVVQKTPADYDVLVDETTLRFTTAPADTVAIDITYLGLRGTEDVVAGSLIIYPFTATASQTTFTGADDNALVLAYTVGYEQVFLNGVKLQNGTDYTATDGTSIVLTVAADLNDVLEVISMGTWLPVDSYTKAQADAKYVPSVGIDASNAVSIEITIDNLGNIITSLPTSSAGLPSGSLWNNSGVVNVA